MSAEVLPFWGESNAKRFVVHFDHEVQPADSADLLPCNGQTQRLDEISVAF